jgi:hypothetical protein
MTNEAWQVVAELEQPARAGFDFDGSDGIAAAVRVLNLSDMVVDQLALAIRVALGRVAERDQHGAVRLILSTKASPLRTGDELQSWGFFLVEKPPHETASHRIEVFLYPDGG